MNADVQKRKELWLERFGCGRERTRKRRVVWLSEGWGDGKPQWRRAQKDELRGRR